MHIYAKMHMHVKILIFFLNPGWQSTAISKVEKIAISWQRFDQSPQKLIHVDLIVCC